MRTAEYSSVADPSKVKDGSGQRTAVRDGNWAVAMADLVAHLVSAYSLLEEIAWQHPQPSLAMDSHDLAFRGVCVALVALDECSTLAWSAPESPVAQGTTSRRQRHGATAFIEHLAWRLGPWTARARPTAATAASP
jgi:hypothetical protein